MNNRMNVSLLIDRDIQDKIKSGCYKLCGLLKDANNNQIIKHIPLLKPNSNTNPNKLGIALTIGIVSFAAYKLGKMHQNKRVLEKTNAQVSELNAEIYELKMELNELKSELDSMKKIDVDLKSEETDKINSLYN